MPRAHRGHGGRRCPWLCCVSERHSVFCSSLVYQYQRLGLKSRKLKMCPSPQEVATGHLSLVYCSRTPGVAWMWSEKSQIGCQPPLKLFMWLLPSWCRKLNDVVSPGLLGAHSPCELHPWTCDFAAPGPSRWCHCLPSLVSRSHGKGATWILWWGGYLHMRFGHD